jgi:hypothetical protein
MFAVKLHTVTQLERVHYIYNLLSLAPQTVNQIFGKLVNDGVEIGLRQIYHDLDQIGLHYLREGEKILCSTGQFNRKTYRLIKESSNTQLTAKDISTFQLIRSSTPRTLRIGRMESLNKFRDVYKDVMKNNSSFYAFMAEDQNMSSAFYESVFDNAHNERLDDMIWAISNYKILIINELKGDATSIPEKITVPITFRPILLIYHRGNHFAGGYESVFNSFITIDISKILQLDLTRKTFAYKKLVESSKNEMKNRFGISNNIDQRSYKIQLEFTSVTGEFISHYFWHHSQQFVKTETGNWLLKIEAGINRELLGWIFQWMGNVRIIKPKILSDLYLEQFVIITQNYSKRKDLKYKNRLIQE